MARPFVRRPKYLIAIAAVLAGLSTAGPISVAAVAAADDARVYDDAKSTRPLQPGAKVPSASVRSVEGRVVDVADLTREAGALLVFYRGGW